MKFISLNDSFILKKQWYLIVCFIVLTMLQIHVSNEAEYEFIKEGKKVGCGGSYEIDKYGKKVDEASCKAKCDANELCTYLWSRESSKKCVLYSSCDGKSEQYKGKLFKKIQAAPEIPAAKSDGSVDVEYAEDNGCKEGQAYHSGALFEDYSNVHDKKECLEKCNSADRCRFWDFGEGWCRLRTNSGNGPQEDRKYISGQKNCILKDCKTLVVGSVEKGQGPKELTFKEEYKCPTKITKTNWLNRETYDDTFSLTQNGVNVVVERTDNGDRTQGWGMNLEIECCNDGNKVESKCISWRQTGGCDPNGSREPWSDKTCDEAVPDGASGYCECQGGERKMEKECSKGGFENCNDACSDEASDVEHHNDAGREKMCPLCTSCDISGSETMAGSGLSLDQCKSKCLDDASCRGIDFGKGGRAGQCYLNHGQNVNFGSHVSFDGYSKNSDCEGETTAPSDCVWDSYTEWTSCSQSCGGGEKTRAREKLREAENGGASCAGDAIETQSCNTQMCPVDCEWGIYGDWSSCSKSCGSGVKSRSRSKVQEAENGGAPCAGDAIETESCSTQMCPVDCEWGIYGMWSSCSKSCGSGVKSRSRSKVQEAENGGSPCVGNAEELYQCNRHDCPIDCEWGNFGEWTSCSKTCGEGEKFRERIKLKTAQHGGVECSGYGTEYAPCDNGGCSKDCVWGEFHQWTPCSKSCGGGFQSRTRSKSQEAENGGSPCIGKATEEEACNTQGCPVDCIWNSFGEWSSCSQSCGEGEKTRRRSIKISAENGGNNCIGSSIETEFCNLGNCPINCIWSEFGDWSDCSKSCGEGEKSRTRYEMTQAENGGDSCEGSNIEVTSCNIDSCPIDCLWDDFGEWSACSKSCGDGTKSRKRSKLSLAEYGGMDCQGNAEEEQSCNLMNCPSLRESKINVEIPPLETSKDKENEDYETQIEMAFFNMNKNKFEELKDELRDVFAKLLKVPKTSIHLTLKKVLLKRSIIDDNSDEESTVLVLTVVTNTLEAAKEIEKSLNMETFVQDLNNEINESEILKQSGIALERVSALIDERVDDQEKKQADKDTNNSNEESGLKKVGETCGEGYGKQGWENCGKCAHGLECEKNTFVVQKCMTCKIKSGDDSSITNEELDEKWKENEKCTKCKPFSPFSSWHSFTLFCALLFI